MEINTISMGLEKVKTDILDATPSINSSLGTLKIGFAQILMFYPLALSIGFVIVCLQLTELIRYNKWVKDKDKPNTLFYNELNQRSPGVIKAEYGSHITAFVGLPFAIVILSIILNLYFIHVIGNNELGILYRNYNPLMM
jgi:hypothetical protein